MKITSTVQPLIFSFANADRLLQALPLTTQVKTTALTLYQGRYYLTVYSGFLQRLPLLQALLEYGSFHGLGVVLDAFIAEHGKRIGDKIRVSKTL